MDYFANINMVNRKSLNNQTGPVKGIGILTSKTSTVISIYL